MSNPQLKQIQVGTKYRFEVASAEEAVSRIREQMGTRARVISVKQKAGKGLGRFISSPRLEIIAMIPEEEARGEPANQEKFLPRATASINHPDSGLDFNRNPQKEQETRERKHPDDQSSLNLGSAAPFQIDTPAEEVGQEDLAPEAFQSGRPQASGPDQPRDLMTDSAPPEGIERILHRAGLDTGMLAQLQQSDKWDEIQDMPLPYALSEFGFFLKQKFRDLPQDVLASRVAFIGLPGTGKTTALCKVLSEKVFRFNEKPKVAKMDSDLPNPDDALRVFCDVLGVEFTAHRPGEEENESSRKPLLLDTGGLGLRDLEAWNEMGRRLDTMQIESRILVLNAAYDVDLLKQQVRMGDRVGATHFILTHLDESQAGLRIWPVLFGAGLAPCILSYGQDVAGDFTSHVFEYLLGETLPTLAKTHS